jgi:hypothetical protein
VICKRGKGTYVVECPRFKNGEGKRRVEKQTGLPTCTPLAPLSMANYVSNGHYRSRRQMVDIPVATPNIAGMTVLN